MGDILVDFEVPMTEASLPGQGERSCLGGGNMLNSDNQLGEAGCVL